MPEIKLHSNNEMKLADMKQYQSQEIQKTPKNHRRSQKSVSEVEVENGGSREYIKQRVSTIIRDLNQTGSEVLPIQPQHIQLNSIHTGCFGSTSAMPVQYQSISEDKYHQPQIMRKGNQSTHASQQVSRCGSQVTMSNENTYHQISQPYLNQPLSHDDENRQDASPTAANQKYIQEIEALRRILSEFNGKNSQLSQQQAQCSVQPKKYISVVQEEYEQAMAEKRLLEVQNVEISGRMIEMEGRLRQRDAEIAKLKGMLEDKKKKPKCKGASTQTDLPDILTPRSPLSVTDCERPPITLIVSSQSLREQYEEAVKKQRRKSTTLGKPVLGGEMGVQKRMNQTAYQTPTRVLALASQPLSSPQADCFSDEESTVLLNFSANDNMQSEYLNQTSILDRQFNSVQLKSGQPKVNKSAVAAEKVKNQKILQNYITSKQEVKVKKVQRRIKSPSSNSSNGYGSATFSPPTLQRVSKPIKPIYQENDTSPRKRDAQFNSQQLINLGFPTQQRRLSSQVAIIPECTNSVQNTSRSADSQQQKSQTYTIPQRQHIKEMSPFAGKQKVLLFGQQRHMVESSASKLLTPVRQQVSVRSNGKGGDSSAQQEVSQGFTRVRESLNTLNMRISATTLSPQTNSACSTPHASALVAGTLFSQQPYPQKLVPGHRFTKSNNYQTVAHSKSPHIKSPNLKSPLTKSTEKKTTDKYRLESKEAKRKAVEEQLKAEREKREKTYDQRIKLFKDQIHQKKNYISTVSMSRPASSNGGTNTNHSSYHILDISKSSGNQQERAVVLVKEKQLEKPNKRLKSIEIITKRTQEQLNSIGSKQEISIHEQDLQMMTLLGSQASFDNTCERPSAPPEPQSLIRLEPIAQSPVKE
ncbi:hypothetical protein FGO68_gene3896 [Halteria grandinella]|uniref:Uncharacterized protein n=1 Tax=Halteria grandinella TaxID=5974 RepID=A0A8J8NFD5_HALGN|nr:hypothetical protein FGO68_gene3896 [Halteria grandinella]